VTFIQLIIGFFIVLFPDLILSIAGKEFVVQPETLGVLLLVHLVAGFGGMSIVVINGMGKSLYSLKMNLVSLAVTLICGYFLIPAFELVGAALAMLCHNLVAIICNNIYLFRRGLWPYSSKLITQVFWILGLVVFYIVLNMNIFTLSMVDKIVVYVVILVLLGLYGILQKGRLERDRQKRKEGI